MADEAGLNHLRTVALDFAVMHFEAVARTSAWASLPRACADAVAAEVSAHPSLWAAAILRSSKDAVAADGCTPPFVRAIGAVSRNGADADAAEVRMHLLSWAEAACEESCILAEPQVPLRVTCPAGLVLQKLDLL